MLEYVIISESLVKNGKFEKVVNILSNDYAEGVMYLVNYIKTNDLLSNDGPQIKNICKSAVLRNLGNNFFSKHEFATALQYYNLALLHAPKGSESMAFAYSNRSAVFFELHKYQAALNDIENAKKDKYPTHLLAKLVKRQNVCKSMLSQDITSKQHLSEVNKYLCKIASPKNIQIPCASNAVTIKYDEVGMAKVVATKSISPGDVIGLEKPFAIHLNIENNLLCCYYCMKYFENLIPCDTCCSALFCSQDCKQKCNSEYHKIECKLMALLTKFPNLARLSIKALIKAKSIFGTWECLMASVESALQDHSDKRGYVKKTSSLQTLDSENYEAICTLVSRADNHKYGRLFHMSVSVAHSVIALSKVYALESKNNKLLKFIACQLLGHMLDNNWTHLSCTCATPSTDFGSQYFPNKAIGFFALIGRINHSCDANVIAIGLDNQLALVALKPIQSGAELLQSFVMHWLEGHIKHRKYIIYKSFSFICKCPPCIENWETEKTVDFQITSSQDDVLLDAILGGKFEINSLEDAVKYYKDLLRGIVAFQNIPLSQYYERYFAKIRLCQMYFQHALIPQSVRGSMIERLDEFEFTKKC